MSRRPPLTGTETDVPVGALLSDAVHRASDHPALHFLGHWISYRRLRREVRSVAAALHRRGIGPGDRVSLVMPPCPQHVVALLAVLRLGAVAVEHHPLAPSAELSRQMLAVGSRAAVVVDHSYRHVAAVREEAHLRFVVVTALADYLPPSRKVAVRLVGTPDSSREADWLSAGLAPDPTSLGFMEFVRTPRGNVSAWHVRPETDPAVLVFGAGPLLDPSDASAQPGVPAPVVLTHSNLVAAATQVRHAARWHPGRETLVLQAPLFTAFGLTSLIAAMSARATTCLLPRYSAEAVREEVAETGATGLVTVPPVLQSLTDTAAARPLGVRTVVTGGMPWSSEQECDRVARALEVAVVPVVGTTECAGVALVGTLPGPLAPVWRTEMTRTESDLRVRGPQISPGYRLRDGSLGAVGEWLTLCSPEPCRPGSGIVTGGMEVSPAEVVAALRLHPDVADAVVTAVPHPRRGDAVRAYVAPAAGRTVDPEALTTHLRGLLAPYKLPRETVVVAELYPRHDAAEQDATEPARRTLGP